MTPSAQMSMPLPTGGRVRGLEDERCGIGFEMVTSERGKPLAVTFEGGEATG